MTAHREARSLAEALLWLELHDLAREHHAVETEGDRLRITWHCVRGTAEAREVVSFLVPRELPPGREGLFGGPGPSVLLAPRDFARHARQLLGSVPPSPAGFVQEAAQAAASDLAVAAGCLQEIRKFIPASGTRLPPALAEGVPGEWADLRGIEAAVREIHEQAEHWQDVLPRLPPSRPLEQYPAAQVRLDRQVVQQVVAAGEPYVDDIIAGAAGTWWFVARTADPPRALFRNPAGCVLRAELDGDRAVGLHLLEGRAAVEAMVAEGLRLSPRKRLRVKAALAPGRPWEAALKEAFPHPDGCSPLPGVRSGGEELRFLVAQTAEDHRVVVLALRIGADGALLGHRIIQGHAALEQLTVLREVAPHLRGPRGEAPEAASMDRAMRSAEVIVAEVQPLLSALARGAVDVAAVAPRDEDFDKVFQGPQVGAIRARYRELWAQDPPRVRAPAEATEVVVGLCPGGGFLEGLPLAADFPAGYREVAGHFVPSRTWLAWGYRVPGGRVTRTYDGLVWVDDHWAWFPRPDRVIGGLG